MPTTSYSAPRTYVPSSASVRRPFRSRVLSWFFLVALATLSEGVSYPQASVRTLIKLLARVHEGVRPVGAAIVESSLKLTAANAVPGTGRV